MAMDDGPPQEPGSAKASAKASGRGKSFAAQRDLMKRGVTINNSVILLGEPRAEEATRPERHAEELRDQLSELRKQLAVVSEAALITQSRLQDAEHRRRAAESQLQQAQRERDQALQLVRQAQVLMTDTRAELGELI
jgi:chromosome segregation ATPase